MTFSALAANASPLTGSNNLFGGTNSNFGLGAGLLSVAPTASSTTSPAKVSSSTNAQSSFSFGSMTTPSATGLMVSSTAGSTTSFANISSEILEEPADYDPCPDFKAIIPLPDEVEVTTGEENEEMVFSHRAKLFRMIEKEWKERGIGNIKILKSKTEGKYRVLMRREQVHKLCANHQITPEIELKPVKDKQDQFIYVANDFAEEKLQLETFLVRFKEARVAQQFKEAFEAAKKDLASNQTPEMPPAALLKPLAPKSTNLLKTPDPDATPTSATIGQAQPKSLFSAGTAFTTPPVTTTTTTPATNDKPSPFASFTFGNSNPSKGFSSIFGNIGKTPDKVESAPLLPTPQKPTESEETDDFVPTATFAPVIALPDLVETVTGEENENVLFEHRAKLFRFDRDTKEWKERGLGDIKVLVNKTDTGKVRLLMRREQIFKICCNQFLLADTKFEKVDKPPSVRWHGPDYSENETAFEYLALRFKTLELRDNFYDAVTKAKENMGAAGGVITEQKKEAEPVAAAAGWGDKFKVKAGSWSCEACYISNTAETLYCVACDSPKDSTVPKKEPANLLATASTNKFSFGTAPATSQFVFGTGGGFAFGAPPAASGATPAPVTFGSVPTAPVTFGAAPAAPGTQLLSFGDLAAQANGNSKDSQLEKETFSFVLKPRSPGKCKSPGAVSADEQTDDEYQEEENNTYFAPVVQLAAVRLFLLV